MSQIHEDVIEHLRKENDIVEVIEDYVQLKKQGKNYFGLCPFHDEKSPSFSVTKEKQIFHCFGCGKGGNVITFLMEKESISFIEAIELLADRINYTLPQTNRKQAPLSSNQKSILEAHDWLTKYYHHLLKFSEEGKNGLTYFAERGIDEDTINEFQLGFAPSDSKFTTEFLEEKGFHLQFLVKNGLLTTNDNQHFNDIFRGRVIFPIKNHRGQAIGFGGRAINGEQPKYLNSKEHELFQKSNLLFNFDLAKKEIRRKNSVIIFEGYMDVIAAYQAEIKNGVATLGTALSMFQAKLLKRYVDEVILCYDADDAGMQATYDAAQLFEQLGSTVKVASLKDGMDPDDYIRKYGAQSFRKNVIEQANSYFRFYMQFKRKDYNLKVDSERIAYVEHMVAQLATIESTIEREYYIKDLATEFNLSTDIIQHDVEKQQQRNFQPNKDNSFQNRNTTSRQATYQAILPAHIKAERYLIAYMFKHPYIVEKVQQQIGVSFNVEEHCIIVTHLYGLFEAYNEVNVSQLIDKIDDEQTKTIVTDIAMISVGDDVSDIEIDDYITFIQHEATTGTRLRYLEQKQRETTDSMEAIKIGAEIIELSKQLNMR